MNSKERCLAAINGQDVDRAPVFPLLMHLSAQHAGITYREFAGNGSAMAQAQLLMLEKFGLDAITSCTDAFRVPADLGGEMVFPESGPPHLAKPMVRNEEDFKNLKKPDISDPAGRMADRLKGISEMAKAVGDQCLVLGWVEMPFAEACSICGLTEVMMMMFDNPKLLHSLMEFLTDITIDFSLAQLEAGAPMIGAGDAAASLISPEQYRQFALPYEQRICKAIHDKAGLAKLHICGNTTGILEDITSCGADLFNVDHVVDFDLACETYKKAQKCFKGNIDPVADMFQATPEHCEKRSIQCLQAAQGLRYMLSPGCEVPAGIGDEVFHAFCQAPKKFADQAG
ncbi:MAG: uroporphyrinogen decarboxylase family protein [Planctomycetota bacterium]